MMSPEQPPLRFEEGVQSLQNRPFVEGPGFRELAMLSEEDVEDDVRLFAAAFIRRAKRLYVPLMVDRLFQPGRHVVIIFHAVRGDRLFDKEWQLIGHLGSEVAGALGVKMQWGGMVQPSRWSLLRE